MLRGRLRPEMFPQFRHRATAAATTGACHLQVGVLSLSDLAARVLSVRRTDLMVFRRASYVSPSVFLRLGSFDDLSGAGAGRQCSRYCVSVSVCLCVRVRAWIGAFACVALPRVAGWFRVLFY